MVKVLFVLLVTLAYPCPGAAMIEKCKNYSFSEKLIY